MTNDYNIELYYDGDCPLCSREINLLRRLDRRGRVRFTDITAPGFDPSPYGLDMDRLMARIHGRLPDGLVIEGVEVFRRVYEALGFRWLVIPTRWPGFSHLLDASYRLFARNRLRWTGRCAGNVCRPAA